MPPRDTTPTLPFERTQTRISFDIEIADEIDLAPGEDLDQHGPFQISCAAAITDCGRLKHWYARDNSGLVARSLDSGGARAVLVHLREAQQSGAMICAWNGLSFDLRWLGHAAADMPLAREVALDLFDPMFQFFVLRGFPVGLASVAAGLGIDEKKLMHGADAPKEWARGNHQAVLDYVAGDCKLTDTVIARILAAGEIRWRTKKGSLSAQAMPRLLAVRELLDAPLPDTSWMSEPMPRAKFTKWLEC
ncbi:MAG TPA: ribonuclease H-like domain-containing protein [Planctomycetota bacterium]|nr:ribonuclease H-like domain-containing protein [Planctomycetota bacterium]